MGSNFVATSSEHQSRSPTSSPLRRSTSTGVQLRRNFVGTPAQGSNSSQLRRSTSPGVQLRHNFVGAPAQGPHFVAASSEHQRGSPTSSQLRRNTSPGSLGLWSLYLWAHGPWALYLAPALGPLFGGVGPPLFTIKGSHGWLYNSHPFSFLCLKDTL